MPLSISLPPNFEREGTVSCEEGVWVGPLEKEQRVGEGKVSVGEKSSTEPDTRGGLAGGQQVFWGSARSHGGRGKRKAPLSVMLRPGGGYSLTSLRIAGQDLSCFEAVFGCWSATLPQD